MRTDEYEKIGENVCRVAMTYMPFGGCRARLHSVLRKIAAVLYERYIRFIAIRLPKDSNKSSGKKPESEQPSSLSEEKTLPALGEQRGRLGSEPVCAENMMEPAVNPQTAEEEPEQLPPIDSGLLPAADLDEIAKELIAEGEEVKAKGSENPGQGEDEGSDSDDNSSTESEAEIRSRIIAQRHKKKRKTKRKRTEGKRKPAPPQVNLPHPRRTQRQSQPAPGRGQLAKSVIVCPIPKFQREIVQDTRDMTPKVGSQDMGGKSMIYSVSSTNKTRGADNDNEFPLKISRMRMQATANRPRVGRALITKPGGEIARYGTSLNRSMALACNYLRPILRTPGDADFGLQGSRIGRSKAAGSVWSSKLNRTQNVIRNQGKRLQPADTGDESMLSTPKCQEIVTRLLSREESKSKQCIAITAKDGLLIENSLGFRSKQELLRRSSQQTRLKPYRLSSMYERSEPAREYVSFEPFQIPPLINKLTRPSRGTHYRRRMPDTGTGERRTLLTLEGRSQFALPQ